MKKSNNTDRPVNTEVQRTGLVSKTGHIRRRVVKNFYKESRTQQHMADETLTKNIVDRYIKTGVLHSPGAREMSQGSYGDFSNLGSYHDSFNLVIGAQEAFEALPARVRERFRNDPGECVRFCMDPRNRVEAQELGLINPDPSSPSQANSTVPPGRREAPEGRSHVEDGDEPPKGAGGSKNSLKSNRPTGDES